MKFLRLVILVMFAQTSFASVESSIEADVYCKVGTQTLSIFDENGWQCRQFLLSPEAVDRSQACFTGPRKSVIDILNALAETDFFDGTDGEYIRGAKYRGTDSISYLYVNESSEEISKTSIARCSKEF